MFRRTAAPTKTRDHRGSGEGRRHDPEARRHTGVGRIRRFVCRPGRLHLEHRVQRPGRGPTRRRVAIPRKLQTARFNTRPAATRTACRSGPRSQSGESACPLREPDTHPGVIPSRPRFERQGPRRRVTVGRSAGQAEPRSPETRSAAFGPVAGSATWIPSRFASRSRALASGYRGTAQGAGRSWLSGGCRDLGGGPKRPGSCPSPRPPPKLLAKRALDYESHAYSGKSMPEAISRLGRDLPAGNGAAASVSVMPHFRSSRRRGRGMEATPSWASPVGQGLTNEEGVYLPSPRSSVSRSMHAVWIRRSGYLGNPASVEASAKPILRRVTGWASAR
jgi:hypothetical protein